MSEGYSVPQDEIENNLRSLAVAYPISIFPELDPPAAQEDDRVRKQLSRSAAMLMRHHSMFLIQAADRLAALEAALADARLGLIYIKTTYGELYGVGFERVERKCAELLGEEE